MELLMINKISPRPSLLKRGREKAEMPHSFTRRALIFLGMVNWPRDLISVVNGFIACTLNLHIFYLNSEYQNSETIAILF